MEMKKNDYMLEIDILRNSLPLDSRLLNVVGVRI